MSDTIFETSPQAPASARKNAPDCLSWASKIKTAWQETVANIVETGRLLIEAKAELAHGRFEHMVQRQLPFSPRTARMLMKIAEHPIVSNRKHVSVLPSSWGTLYQLALLPPDFCEDCIENGSIYPKMERKDAAALKPPLDKGDDGTVAPSPTLATPPVKTLTSGKAPEFEPLGATPEFIHQAPVCLQPAINGSVEVPDTEPVTGRVLETVPDTSTVPVTAGRVEAKIAPTNDGVGDRSLSGDCNGGCGDGDIEHEPNGKSEPLDGETTNTELIVAIKNVLEILSRHTRRHTKAGKAVETKLTCALDHVRGWQSALMKKVLKEKARSTELMTGGVLDDERFGRPNPIVFSSACCTDAEVTNG